MGYPVCSLSKKQQVTWSGILIVSRDEVLLLLLVGIPWKNAGTQLENGLDKARAVKSFGRYSSPKVLVAKKVFGLVYEIVACKLIGNTKVIF